MKQESESGNAANRSSVQFTSPVVGEYLEAGQVSEPTCEAEIVSDSDYVTVPADSAQVRFTKFDGFLVMVGLGVLTVSGLLGAVVIIPVGYLAPDYLAFAGVPSGILQSLVSVLAATFFANPLGKFVQNSDPTSWKREEGDRSGTLSTIIALSISIFLTPIGWVFFVFVGIFGGFFGLVTSAILPGIVLWIFLAVFIPIIVVPISFLYFYLLNLFLLGGS